MKLKYLFFFSLFFILIFTVESLPDYEGYFNDFTGKFSSSAQIEIEHALNYIYKNGNYVVVFAVVDNYYGVNDINLFSVELFDKWQPGKSGEDNGILVVLNAEENEINVQTGYGAEGDFPDGRVGRILDEVFIPLYTQEKYTEAFIKMAMIFGQVEEIGNFRVSDDVNQREEIPLFAVIIFFIFFGILFMINPRLAFLLLYMMMARGRGSYGGSGSFSGGVGGFGGGMTGGGGAGRKF
ncbi:MAG: TPM domain-containing protein [Candidatus Muiribacteriota bacterium]